MQQDDRLYLGHMLDMARITFDTPLAVVYNGVTIKL
jgi:hypothetical protein